MSDKSDTSFKFIFISFLTSSSALLLFYLSLISIQWNFFNASIYSQIITNFVRIKTHPSELLNRTVRCPAFLALKSDDMFVRTLLSHDFWPRLGSIMCGIVVFQIACNGRLYMLKHLSLINDMFEAGF